MTIGTIASDREITVQFLKGSRLGTIEETFISKLQPGDKFTFGGRTLKLVQVKDILMSTTTMTSGATVNKPGSKNETI